MVGILRFIMLFFYSEHFHHADEYWQGTEVAYSFVYGGKDIDLPWEWQDQYRIRNVLYPGFLAIPLYILKTLGLDYN